MMTREQLVLIRKALLAAAAVVLATVLPQDYAADHDDRYAVTIHVTNKLSSRMALIVHCRSRYVDLAARFVVADSSCNWKFNRNDAYPGTDFKCRLAFQDKRLDFLAITVHKGVAEYVYDVFDDGVYGADGRISEWA
ncbi:unnamed protein product [Linum tenue]|uniref:S-protein homolog n=1 Tax=Linum tenue TaxID=586396 RepID=A0AAV0ID46_9ROSI|nr:unnamed protein product [Linum tenue]